MTIKISAIIPAHNEEHTLTNAIESLRQQGITRIIVANDNSTDDTQSVAEKLGVTVFKTINNKSKKAGALNQALNKYIDWEDDNQAVIIQDADTVLNSTWVATAVKLLNKGYDAVGAVFEADKKNNYLRYCQHLEWQRYIQEIKLKHKVQVLSGTASMIRFKKLKEVHKKYGHFYQEEAITEDFALTLALKEVKAKMISPVSCIVTTETMPSTKTLFSQRRRWYLGALQQLKYHKWSRVMLPYIGQQLLLSISIISFWLVWGLSINSILANNYTIYPFWLAIGSIFIVERVLTVWRVGWKARITALLMFPELIYAIILQFSFIAAWIHFIRGKKGVWDHVPSV